VTSAAESLQPVPPEHLGLGRAELSAALSSGALLRVGRGYLTAAAIDRAVAVLDRLPQPFTVSQAKSALGVSRGIALPLLQHLDRVGVTRCHADLTRSVRR
jgi:selenocysteine-specific elongation factor